jgi:DNA-binding response OmpR family regulator
MPGASADRALVTEALPQLRGASGLLLTGESTMSRILIVEDDCDIGALLRLHVGECAAEVELEANGARGLLLAQRGHWDLLVLDWRLPGLDGVSICRKLRANEYRQPILMLTARTTEFDRVMGLDAGADDYVAKPFSAAELKARIRAQLRRAERFAGEKPNDEGAAEAGPFTIDLSARRARFESRPLALTAREFDLLAHFVRHPGKVYTRQQLLEIVWGGGFEGYEYTVNSHINRLRAKVEPHPAEPIFLKTVWGVGYRFDAAVGS